MLNILVTTRYKGVFFAQVDRGTDITSRTLTNLRNCRMVIYFGTTRGVMELAQTGPTQATSISAAADIPVLHGVTAVFAVTDEAAAKWLA